MTEECVYVVQIYDGDIRQWSVDSIHATRKLAYDRVDALKAAGHVDDAITERWEVLGSDV